MSRNQPRIQQLPTRAAPIPWHRTSTRQPGSSLSSPALIAQTILVTGQHCRPGFFCFYIQKLLLLPSGPKLRVTRGVLSKPLQRLVISERLRIITYHYSRQVTPGKGPRIESVVKRLYYLVAPSHSHPTASRTYTARLLSRKKSSIGC